MMGDRVAESDQSSLDEGSGRGFSTPGSPDAGLCETYPAVAASVAAIRVMVARFATEAGAGPAVVEAARLAVSEAATNVVVHAYTDAAQPGVIEVEVTHAGGELRVTVADTGPGLRSGPQRPGLGLGLVLIEQLADHVELLQGGDHGLRLVMRFVTSAGTPRPDRA